MTHTHTPGPFPLHIQSNGERYAIITAQGNHFATTHDPSAARLIAAAPELLSALVALADEFDAYDNKLTEIGRGHEDYGRKRYNARAAITKAEGREA